MIALHASMWDGRVRAIRATEHCITLEKTGQLIRFMLYRQDLARRAIVKAEVEKQLAAGVSGPTTGKWASLVVLILKKDETLRFCVDYAKLNTLTHSDAYPLARMENCVESLGEATVFSILQCNSDYWQNRIAPADQDTTTFNSYLRSFQYKRMSFRVRNAPAISKRATDMILSGVRWQICLVYVDGVIVFSPTYDEHLQHLGKLLSLLRRSGI